MVIEDCSNNKFESQKGKKIRQEVNEKREKINKWHSDNIVVECCCLVQARLSKKYNGHGNRSEKRVMQIIVCFSNKVLIIHCEWISLRGKCLFFSIFLPCVFLKGVSVTLTKRNYSLGNLNTMRATVSLSKLNYFSLYSLG